MNHFLVEMGVFLGGHFSRVEVTIFVQFQCNFQRLRATNTDWNGMLFSSRFSFSAKKIGRPLFLSSTVIKQTEKNIHFHELRIKMNTLPSYTNTN